MEHEEKDISEKLHVSKKKLDRLEEKISGLKSSKEVSKQELRECEKEKEDYQQTIAELKKKKEEIKEKKRKCEIKIKKIEAQQSLQSASTGSTG